MTHRYSSEQVDLVRARDIERRIRRQLARCPDQVETWKRSALASREPRARVLRWARKSRAASVLFAFAASTVLGLAAHAPMVGVVVLVPLAAGAFHAAQAAEDRERLGMAVAWTALGKGDLLEAHRAIAALPGSALKPHLVAAYLRTCNRLEEAAALLDHERHTGHFSPDMTKLLVDIRIRQGRPDMALEVARSGPLTADDLATVQAAVGVKGPA